MEWNSALYDKKHDFVEETGKGLLEFVPKNGGQTILDLMIHHKISIVPAELEHRQLDLLCLVIM